MKENEKKTPDPLDGATIATVGSSVVTNKEQPIWMSLGIAPPSDKEVLLSLVGATDVVLRLSVHNPVIFPKPPKVGDKVTIKEGGENHEYEVIHTPLITHKF